MITSHIHRQDKPAQPYLGLPSALGRSAFDWQREPQEPRELTREEIQAEKNRVQTRERYRRKTAAQHSAQVLRVNPESNIGCSTANDRDKTARIIGRRNEARSP